MSKPAPRRSPRGVHFMTAYGETKTIWEWGQDPRCFVSSATLYQRYHAFPRPVEEHDAEAALCLPTWSAAWSFYRKYGYLTEELLAEALGET